MKNSYKLLVLIMLLTVFLGLMACDSSLGGNDSDNDVDNVDDGIGEELEGLVLIENKTAKFQIVYTSNVGSIVVKRVEKLVKQLRELGISINNPVREGDRNLVAECEIIIGSGAKNRGEDLSVTKIELGADGLLVKIVGQKILIAAGNDEDTVALFEKYIEEEMGITDKTEAISSLAVNPGYSYIRKTDYQIDSFTIASVDIKEFTIVYDIMELGTFDTGKLQKFRDEIYNKSGIWLLEAEVKDMDKYRHRIIFRYCEDAGEKGFRVFEKDGDFIIECSYKNAFERAFEEYATALLYENRNTKISLPENYLKETDVTVVHYKDFGAKGDGITDDYSAILAAHEYANGGGQKVIASPNAVYYISPKTFTKGIPVYTDVDLRGATFIVDDRGDDAFTYRTKPIFLLEGDHAYKRLRVSNIETEALEFDGVKVSVPEGTTSLPWLVPYLDADVSMVRIQNQAHRDYVRWGSNQNKGQIRRETLVVYADGSISEDTFVFFDYEKLTDIYIYRGDDKPITIENGNFYNICCQASLVTHPQYGGITVYQSFKRGMNIGRANVTIKNITHGMVDQPIVLSNKDDKDGSYPYSGFFSIREAYNLRIEDCVLTGHTTYWERKAATESAGGVGGEDNFVAAGSYDLTVNDSTHITFINVDQENIDYTMDSNNNIIAQNGGIDNGIGDQRYWGIMGSGYGRNLTFRDCEISRIDAHEGFFNVDVIDCIIGHTFHAVGGGRLYLENMTRLAGDKYIVTRSDYGGTFKGDITIKNGELCGYQAYNSSVWYNGDHSLNTEKIKYSYGYILDTGYREQNDNLDTYFEWDFGYDCYMPETITFIGNFNSGIKKIYISNKNYHEYYTVYVPQIKARNPDYHPYELIKTIIYKDWNGEQFYINRREEAVGRENDYMARNCNIVVEK